MLDFFIKLCYTIFEIEGDNPTKKQKGNHYGTENKCKCTQNGGVALADNRFCNRKNPWLCFVVVVDSFSAYYRQCRSDYPYPAHLPHYRLHR